MDNEQSKAQKALRTLARRVEHGLTKLQPVSAAHLAKVREAVRREWEQTHQGQEAAPTTLPTKSKSKRQQQDKSSSHDKSNDHGHSH